MLSPFVRKQTLRLQRQWSSDERVARARIARHRYSQLLASVYAPAQKTPEVWAAGSMTVHDLQRIAG